MPDSPSLTDEPSGLDPTGGPERAGAAPAPVEHADAAVSDPGPNRVVTDLPTDPGTAAVTPASDEAFEQLLTAEHLTAPPVDAGQVDDGATVTPADGGPVELAPPVEAAPAAAPAGRKLRPLPRVIAIANQKGGVGKTTTTVNLGAALAEQDRRVLVIDLDPQGNATTGLGINSRELDHSIYDVLLNDVDLDDCIEPTSVLNLFLAPASLDLAGAEIELVSVMSRETRLKRAIDQVSGDYDYVLIDCPPSLGLLTVNALAAATEVMVPIQCEYYALEGLGQLMRNVDLVQRNLNPRLELSLIVLVMYDGRTKLGEQVAAEVREHFGERVCRNVIPRNIRLSEAPSYGQPITVFDSSSKGAVAYRELAREVHHGSA